MEEWIDMWLPDLNSLEYWKSQEPTKYAGYGWSALVVPTECTYVSARMTELGTRFLERYGNRMLNAETLPRWQIRLQNRFDEVVDKWNRAYLLYTTQSTAMLNDIKTGTKTTVSGTVQASGSDSSSNTNTNKVADTPDSVINLNDSYADRVSKNTGSGSVTYGKKDTTNSTTTSEDTGILLENVNRTVHDWEDIDTEFIKDFENNFLNIFYY